VAEVSQAHGPSSDGAGNPRDRSRRPLRRTDAFWTGPVVGLAVLALLGVAYAVLGRPHRTPAPPPLLGVIPQAQIAAVTFRSGGRALTIYRDTGVHIGLGVKWAIGSPTGPAADDTLMGGFVSSLLSLSATRLVTRHPTAAQLATWGLHPPLSSVTIRRTGGRPPVQLDVGRESPVSDDYAMVAGRPAVYLINTYVAGEISANPTNWLAAQSSTATGSGGSGTSSHTVARAAPAAGAQARRAVAAKGQPPAGHAATRPPSRR
jgi:hypothetical protein